MIAAGWSSARIEELATKVGSGATPKGGEAAYKKSGTPFIRSMNVVFFGFKRDGLAYLDDGQAAALKGVEVHAGDVLLNITGASIGRVTLAPPDLAGARVNQHVCIVRPSAAIDARFLSAYLSSPAMQAAITEENYGVTRQALTKQQVLGFEVPLPPLPEQKRIADRLDALLARMDACRQRLDRLPGILKRFRQAVLAAATSGELTREWRLSSKLGKTGGELLDAMRARHHAQQQHAHRGRRSRASTGDSHRMSDALEEAEAAALPEVPRTWAWASGAEVVEPGADIVYGIVQPGPKLAAGVPYVRGMDIVDGRILVEQLMRTSPEIAMRYQRSSLAGGDVILGIIRATKVAIVPETLAGANITQGTARFRPSAGISSKYLSLALQASSTQAWLHAHYRGIDMPGLNLVDVRRVPIPLPPTEEQEEICRRVAELFALLDALEGRQTAADAAVARLTRSALAAAFRGELVPQDPNDEPASVLLERIRAQAGSPQPTQNPKRSRVTSRTKGRAKAAGRAARGR